MFYLYLHGFASGPDSGKARFFQRKLASEGIDLSIPDLSRGDFQHLTISGQLEAIREQLAGRSEAVLIGSSMGGYLAALTASLHPEVKRVLLLAPAFGFAHRWHLKLGPEVTERWQETGTKEFFHYGYGRPMPVHWELMADGLRYPAEPNFTQPAIIFHGEHDDVVPADFSRDFAATHSNVDLTILDSDHQLTDQVETMWTKSRDFLLTSS